jgi:glycerophosphoryl diester phosphodiesterase
MIPYLSAEHPIRFAHRGSRILWPENTMIAFQGAVDLGYRYLETDLHVSRDGKVLVFHDDTLQRLTDGAGKVWEQDWEELRKLDTGFRFGPGTGYPWRGRGLGIPLLEELAGAFPEAYLNLDLKQDGIEEAVAAEVARLGIGERIMIGSFRDARISRFRVLTSGTVATSAGPRELARAVAASRVGRAAAGAADALQVPGRLATPRLIAAAHRAGKHLHAWTINDTTTMNRLLDWGVDGIMSDRPDLLNEVMRTRGG